MSVLELPITGADPNFDIKYELDGATYEFRFRFNDREQAWTFSLYDALGKLIRAGVKVVPNFPILSLIADALKPPGSLIMVDAREDRPGEAPTQEEIGEEMTLTYTEGA